MKSLILALSLIALPLFAEEINTITITTTIKTTLDSKTLKVITNEQSSVVITNDTCKKIKLLSEIVKLEDYLKNLTNGVPQYYASDHSEISSNLCNTLTKIWAEAKVVSSNLNVKKLEFKKIP